MKGFPAPSPTCATPDSTKRLNSPSLYSGLSITLNISCSIRLVVVFVFLMAVPSGYSMKTRICFGWFSGKNSTLGGKIPINANELKSKKNVPPKKRIGLKPLNANPRNLRYLFSRLTKNVFWKLCAQFLMKSLYIQKIIGVKTIRFPKILTLGFPSNKIIPRPPMMNVNFHNDLLLICLSLISIN